MSATAEDDNVHVTLLDGFAMHCGEHAVSLPMASQRVVAFLALHRRPLRRAFVAANLWFGGSGSGGQACLRSVLWRVRRSCPLPVVCGTRTHVHLDDSVTVDVDRQILAARRVSDRSAAIDEIACLELRGELLPDWYDNWVVFERERLLQLRLHALEALAARLAEEGRFGEAVDLAYAALDADPLRESAHRTLIRIHLDEGNRADALRGLESYRDLLHSRLGLTPSRDLEELVHGPGDSVTLR